MKKIYVLLLIGMISLSASAQELLCRVSISTNNMEGENTDKTIFSQLERDLTAFMNDRKWSQYNFKTEEKIECGLQIIVEKAMGGDMYQGRVYVQLSRPVFNSSYASPLLSYQDNHLSFKYSSNQQFDYDENSYMWTMTSLAAFYANLFLAITFDSYAPNSGTPFYNKCVNIISSAPSGEPGWSSSTKERRNRYWLLESLTNPSYEALRQFIYQYHRLGLDVMSQNPLETTNLVLTCLESLQKFNTTYSNNAGLAIICATKAVEFTNVFSGAPLEDKQKAAEILKRLDPSNGEKYEKLTK